MIRLFLLSFILLSLTPVQAQLSKSSPFYQQKNFLKSSSVKNKALALIRSECLKLPKQLPPWLTSAAQRTRVLGTKAQTIRFSAKELTQKQMRLAEMNPCILGIGEEGVARTAGFELNDPLFAQQVFYEYSNFKDFYQTFKSPLFKNFQPVTVAVVDSGISLSHPDFLGALWVSGDGHFGYNFLDDNFNVEDLSGHGSHVSGLIAARADNSVGVVGVSQNIKLMTLKTQGIDGNGSVGDVSDAIRYAVDHGAEVINLSLTVGTDSPFIKDAVEYALENEVFIVSASGNNGFEITSENFITPAGYGTSKVGLISVGSVDSHSGELSIFSNYSPTMIEIAAPGSHDTKHILSTYKNERYFGLSGTSMAAPQVTGVLAQLISYFKGRQIPYNLELIEKLVLENSPRNQSLLGKINEQRELNYKAISNTILKNYQLTSDGGLQ